MTTKSLGSVANTSILLMLAVSVAGAIGYLGMQARQAPQREPDVRAMQSDGTTRALAILQGQPASSRASFPLAGPALPPSADPARSMSVGEPATASPSTRQGETLAQPPRIAAATPGAASGAATSIGRSSRSYLPGSRSRAARPPALKTEGGSIGIESLLTFRNGLNGYAGTQDTYLAQYNPDAAQGALDNWRWDLEDPAPNNEYGLIRFDDIFGSGSNQIPVGSTISSAVLTLTVSNGSAVPAGVVNEVTVDWAEGTATWNNFGGDSGVQTDEYGAYVADAPIGTGVVNVDVTSSLQAWAGTPTDSRGWIFRPSSSDGVQTWSSEAATESNRPTLTVQYTTPCSGDPDCDDGVACTDDTCNLVSHTCEHASICTGGKVCNPVTGLCEAPSVPPLPINIGDTWRYSRGTSEPPSDWEDLSFDDSSWTSGPSGFGYGVSGSDCEGQRGTLLSDMQNAYLSVYTRRRFYVPDPNAVYGLSLTMYYDDSFVAYLNGQEVARSISPGSPNIAGNPPAYNTAASPNHECSSASPETFDLDESKLVAGINVIAIQGHNATLGSTDFIIAPKLEAVAPPNQPPSQPTDPSPQDDAVGVGLDPQLCVNVSDPEAQPLDVTFYGREATGVAGDDFTVVVLPDPQNYAANSGLNYIYAAQAQWCVDNRVARNIVFVTGLGDMTNDASAGQWSVVDSVFDIIENPATTGLPDGMPYGMCVGNHDQNPSGSARSGTDESATTVQYNSTFGKARFQGRGYFGGNYTFGGADPGSMDNHYELFSASGMDFIVFHLEVDGMGTGYAGTCSSATCLQVVQWMDDLLTNTYPDRRAIIVSHALMQPTGNPPAFMEHGQVIYDAIKDNPNVFLAMCGHLDQANHRADTYMVGGQPHTVYTLISDYQSRSNGGNGWLRILTFSPQNDTIHVETYSPTVEGGRFINKPTAHADNQPNDACASDCVNGGNELFLPYDMEAGPPFSIVGSETDVASGSQVCVPWPGREMDKTYEWYVRVSDGTSTTTGSRWSFTTITTCSVPAECDDGNPCTDDDCVANLCVYTNNTGPCADDGNPCTDEVCGGGQCTHPADDTNLCTDANLCTTDACSGGTCVRTYAPTPGCCTTSADCNDGNPGTTDVCDAGTCSNVPTQICTTSAECDDEDACTTDICVGGNASALSFDGVDDNVDLGNASGLTDFGTGSFTVEGWIYTDGGNADRTGIVRFGRQGDAMQVAVQLTGAAAPYLALAGSVETNGAGNQVDVNYQGATITPSQWHHFALVVDRSGLPSDPNLQQLRLHIDGGAAIVASAAGWGSYAMSSADAVVFGAARLDTGALGLFYDGRLDEVRVWDHARTQQEIQDNMDLEVTSAPGLLHRWGMNEQSGGTVADDPGTSDGLLEPTPPTNAPGWVTGSGNLPSLGTGTCQHTPVGGCCNTDAECGDGNTCTIDTCNLGAHTCQHDPPPGQCCFDADCNDSDACTTDTCSTGSNACVHEFNAAPCDDADPCTTGDICSGGVCAGATMDCSDGNACTTDSCSGGTCMHAYTPTPGCCASSADCNDGNPATADTCSAGNCENAPTGACTTAADCNDTNSCTTDTCVGGNAFALNFDGVDDHVTMGAAPGLNPPGGSFTLEAWIKGVGGTGTSTGTEGLSSAIPMVTKGRAQADTPANLNMAYFLGISGGKLVGDFEDSTSGLNHAVCATTNLPTSGWHHVAATYSPANGWRLYLDGSPLAAANTNPACSTCTGANCTTTPGASPEPNSIQHFALGTAIDSNGSVAGRYAGKMDEVRVWKIERTAQQISDNRAVVITSDPDLVGRWGFEDGSTATDSTSPAENGTLAGSPVFDPAEKPDLGTGTCYHTPANEGASCDDSDACTTGTTCASGICRGGAPLDCDDGNDCTADSCDTVLGCQHAPANESGVCSDACRIGGTCTGGVCGGGTPTNCGDGNDCTADSCDSVLGCQHAPANEGGTCSDVCRTGGTCTSGVCGGGSPLDCDDGKVCTDDSCNPATGCVHTNNTAPCTDNNACTTSDTCSVGACVGGAPLNCDDLNPCTSDSCDQQTGCVHSPSGSACTDGNACTADTCSLAASQFALDFAPNGYVDVGSGATINNHGTGSFTIEGWVWADSISADRVGIFRQGRQGSYPQVAVQLMANRTIAASVEAYTSPYVAAQVDVQSTQAINLGQWYHVAAVIDRTPGAQALRLYVNGTLAAQDTTNPNTLWASRPIDMVPNDSSIIGAARGADAAMLLWHDGRIDEVRMWNHARNAQQIADNMNRRITSGNGLLARWGFDEGTGTTAADSSGNGNNGTLMGMPASPWVAGAIGLPTNTCSYSGIQGCCLTAAECNDSNVCTDDACTSNVCVHTNNSAPCNDGDSCTSGDACSDGSCSGTPIPGCCSSDAQCDDSNVCTADSCDTSNVAAIGLNGSTQYVDLGNDNNSTNVNYLTYFGTSDFTIEGLFYANAANSYCGIFRMGQQGSSPQVVVQCPGASPYNRLALSVETSKGDNTTQVDTANPPTFTLNAWHHFALVVTRDLVTPANQRLTLYFDGAFVESTDATKWSTYAINDKDINGLPAVARPVWVGVARNSSGTQLAGSYFNGRVDELRIWNHARTAQQISDNKSKQILSASGLVHRWAMNEGTGGTTADSGATPTTAATLVGAPAWMTNPADIPMLGDDRCAHTPVSGGCDDGDVCTQTDTCQSGVCTGSNPLPCDDEDACNGIETCDPGSGCQPGTPLICDDGLYCNGAETCSPSAGCQPGTPPCDDGVACTADSCLEDTDQCVHDPVPMNGSSCDDGRYCTVNDVCAGGICSGGARDCADGEFCTADSCDEVGDTCVHDPVPLNGTSCDDGLYCTISDVCAGGVCGGGGGRNCADTNACTADSCDEVGDTCVHDPVPMNGTGCDDGLYCTINDVCAGGVCGGGGGRDCADANACTADSCDEVGDTCVHDPVPMNGTTCIDGNLCTGPDLCANGACVGAPIPNCCVVDGDCNDGLTCTNDFCPLGTNTAALQFDGVNDYVTMGPAAGESALGARDFTLEGWIQWNGTGWGVATSTGTGGVSAVPLITKGRGEAENSNVDCGYFLGVIPGTGKLAADFEQYGTEGGASPGQNRPACGTIAIAASGWHHVAVTYSRTEGWRFYVDGVEGTAADGTYCTSCTASICTRNPGVTPRYDSIQHFGLGTAMNSTGVADGYFKGMMDEARVWNRALSQVEIQASMNREMTSGTGLIGRWGLNEGSGTTANDSTTPAQNGTLTGGVAWTTGGLRDFGTPNVCEHDPIAGCCDTAADCGDGNICTDDVCTDHTCGHNPIPNCCVTAGECNDGNVCTTDTCDANQCNHTNNTLPCSDGNSCTSDDICSAGTCGGTPIPDCCTTDAACDDGSVCTSDTCSTANVAAIELNGTSQYVNLGSDGNTANLNYLTNFQNSDFTIEGWFWADTANAGYIGLFRGGRQSSNPQVVIQTAPSSAYNRLAASVEAYTCPYSAVQVDVTSPATFTTNADGVNHRWHHFALIVDRTIQVPETTQMLRICLDGVCTSGNANLWSALPVDMTAPPTPCTNPRTRDATLLGVARDTSGNPTAATYFDGRLDEVRIWNYAWIASDFTAYKGKQVLSAPGLMHRWAMNEGTGATTTADSGSTPTAAATLVGSPTWRTIPDIPTFGNDRCVHAATNEGGACDDGNLCTLGEVCSAGVCGGGTAPVEVCDGVDNDCDGSTDEDLGSTTCGVGGCEVTVQNCVGGVPQTCVPGTPAAEICDGVDNDCDGAVDEEGSTLCNDNDACTTDSCDSVLGCQHTAVICDDSDVCTADSCNSLTGCVFTALPAAEEVLDLRVTQTGQTTLLWTGQGVGLGYDIVSGLGSELNRDHGVGAGQCLANGVAGTTLDDTRPNPGLKQMYYYLVRAQNACSTGTYGFASSGAERLPTAGCP